MFLEQGGCAYLLCRRETKPMERRKEKDSISYATF